MDDRRRRKTRQPSGKRSHTIRALAMFAIIAGGAAAWWFSSNRSEASEDRGSFLCTDHYCSRYMVGTRGKGESSTGTNHLGFRLVSMP
jgi:formylglycine-generating enzyme required for sulfatase activity